jgi:membrane fusion protein, multidrug efflux system
MNYKKSLLIIAGIILIMVVLLIPRILKSDKKTEPKTGPQVQIALVKAIVMKPQKLLNEINANGTVLANQQVDLHPEVSGRLVSLLFKDGQSVKKGELLAKLFDGDLQAQLTKLNVQLDLAEKNEKRQKELLTVNGISRQDYDATLSQVNAVKADIELIRAQVTKTEIHAPFSGKIGLRSIDEGAYVSPSVLVASLQEIDPVRIDFNVPEKFISLVHLDDEISFSIPGVNEDFKGKVFAIEPRIDQVTRTLQIRARCPNSSGKIYPGAFARVRLELKDNEKSLLAPTQSVIPESRGQKVFVVRSGKAVPQKVVVGIRSETDIEVVSGLHPGDTLITDGIIQLKPGIPVKITELK